MTGRGWLVLVAALLACALTARLGWWQLDRAAQKTALESARESQGRLPPLSAPELAADGAAAAAQVQRRVQVRGTWLPEGTVYLDNRPMAGRTGFFVLTPLRLDDGRALLVQRGWLPRHAQERTRLAPYATPAGPVAVSGRLAATPSRLYDFGGAASGPIRQNLDLAAHAAEIRTPLLPLVIVEDGSATNSADGLARQWPLPASDVHKHYGYAVQWFGLCALVAFLYAWFELIRPRRPRRRRAA